MAFKSINRTIGEQLRMYQYQSYDIYIFTGIALVYCIVYWFSANLANIQELVEQETKSLIISTNQDYVPPFVQEPTKYLRYSICNGFTNQKLGIVYGVVMAKELNRTIVLPKVLLNGVQTQAENVQGNDINMKDFGSWFDISVFSQMLFSNGIAYELDGGDISSYTTADCDDVEKQGCLEKLKTQYYSAEKLYFKCPFSTQSLSQEDVLQNRELFLQALHSLQPIEKYSSKLQKAFERLYYLSGKKQYNVLHLRIEDDWFSHCIRWQAIDDGIVRDNCSNNTFIIGQHLIGKGVEQDIPLYVATAWEAVGNGTQVAVMDSLDEAGYTVITHTSLLDDLRKGFDREEQALMDYYLALNAHKFIGNSVSTFSSVLILERQSKGLWSTYYNGGSIPLSLMVPLYKLPWVFTYNSWSTSMDYMLIAAVRSAITVGGLKPYCLFTGDKNSDIYKWMQSQGVEMISHTPKWIIKLAEANTKAADYSLRHSHLYASTEGIVGTFLRIDIPILKELYQYDYVLYTDTDVVFRQAITLDSFPQPLPQALGMGPEMSDEFPYNAGIVLWNIFETRKTHQEFVDFIFATGDALYFRDYGPGDQGALNQFYEAAIRAWKLPSQFNQKPYQPYNEEAVIVHFHGPKPLHYLEFLKNGTCWSSLFGPLCEYGVANGLCFYVVYDWYRFVQDQPYVYELEQICESVINSHLVNQS